ncbi:hypothetical protein UFOVP78_46 [uncultured Caudovirales phage]|uniref:HTH_XRE domain containing protein n=1 Tax=uncultured Caudovirales phage TaxID=2100421 RepID=A0A6J5L5A1_9CAUD|nr:hypothetical protein UFOVP78_46 [uncultured Caudovirales phage]
MRPGRKPSTPRACSPLMLDLFRKLDASGCSVEALTNRSGVAKNVISNWRVGAAAPFLGNVEAVAQALGYRLVLVPAAVRQAGPVMAREREGAAA